MIRFSVSLPSSLRTGTQIRSQSSNPEQLTFSQAPAALNLIAIAPIQPVLGARGSEEVLREPGVLSGLAPASVA